MPIAPTDRITAVHLEPGEPVAIIERWLEANCKGDTEIAFVNIRTTYPAKETVELACVVEFAEENEAMLFKMRWA
ncbi:hypothetical protein OKW76_07090 [Sphingomonas sp. S1-29]|uniref:hypothetical protein n=1 Tax=Sphingomonas sp. S1-29 TaxID=2991074 RepID=UPI00223FC95F|nr:hypothetical protein [Sphingomonas sp. S1-29]UZK70780.1 hypothetical protein OKW76_07090 [Sphingomonas sp. S1-29]